MQAFYNENDAKAAAWLRALIEAGEIAPGHVEERSIADVGADDLAGVRRAHFFTGIGGWDLALRLAGWRDEWPVWTGSCPCQPFSVAGKGKGEADERHLWPEFRRLIAECLPPVVFGEQVASAAGRDWLAAVSADLEGLGYAVASADLCAAGVGAPHIRQRLYFGAVRLADSLGAGLEGHAGHGYDQHGPGRLGAIEAGPASEGGATGGLADAAGPRRERTERRAEGEARDEARMLLSGAGGTARGLADADSGGRVAGVGAPEAARHGGPLVADGGGPPAGPDHLGWAAADWLLCRDGKWRPVEPGTQPLADGLPAVMGRGGDLVRVEDRGWPEAWRRALHESEALLLKEAHNRVGRLRGYGNAIVPQVAAEFICAFVEALSGPAPC